ncbi:MAG: hypothetical protein JWP25_7554 [Bradyrhizobium sp.]|nr:hypothetical protein [Bradyrhizobium sp.]
MPKYSVDREFWWKGLKREVGSTVTMTETEAKYLTHVITPVAAIAAPPALAKVSRKATVAPAPLSVAVAEVPSDGNGAN